MSRPRVVDPTTISDACRDSDYHREDGPMQAIVTANHGYIKHLRSEVQLLLSSPDIKPLQS
jgi:hypothetical protein